MSVERREFETGDPSVSKSARQPASRGPRGRDAHAVAAPPGTPASVEGAWINRYGSIMTLVAEGDRIAGSYSSKTGSTGRYVVAGRQRPPGPTSSTGTTVAIAVSWHPVDGSPLTSSRHWSSGMSGQVFSGGEAEDAMVLSHALVASTSDPGRCEAGTYIDKLIFRRVEGRSSDGGQVAWRTKGRDVPGRIHGPRDEAADPLAGEWASSDGTRLKIMVTPDAGSGIGLVDGVMVGPSGMTSAIDGVTDIHASTSGLALQSMTIAGHLEREGAAAAWAGTLDLRTGSLFLLGLHSYATTRSTSYLQTSMSSHAFARR